MATTSIPVLTTAVQADQSASGSSIAQRDGSGNLTMAQCTSTSHTNSGAQSNTSNTTTVTSTYSVATGDRFIKGDCTSAGFTITLPAVASSNGRRLTIIKINSANTLTIAGNGAENINGSNTTTLTSQYTAKNLWCDGTQWLTH
jgi:hypothetical protein